MEDAVAELRPLAESVIGDAHGTTAWVSNETADRGPVDANKAAKLLLSQLTRPMRLHQAIEFLLGEGAREIVVLGPHHSVHHILNRHLEKHPGVRIHGSSSVQELRTIVRELA